MYLFEFELLSFLHTSPICPGMGLLDYMVALFLVFEGTPIVYIYIYLKSVLPGTCWGLALALGKILNSLMITCSFFYFWVSVCIWHPLDLCFNSLIFPLMSFSLFLFFSVTWKIFFFVPLTLSSFQYRYPRALVSMCVCVCCCFSRVRPSVTPWTQNSARADLNKC